MGRMRGWGGDEPVVVTALRFIVAWTHGSANQQQAHGLCACLGMLPAVRSSGISNLADLRERVCAGGGCKNGSGCVQALS